MTRLERIAVGTDGSEQATKAVAWAAGLAAKLGSELLVVHVFEVDPAKLPGGFVVPPPEELERLREETRRSLDGAWTAVVRESGARWRPFLLDGTAAKGLMDAAQSEGADLIVVGSRGRSGFAELLLGSVGHHLVQHSQISVVIVPSCRG